MYCMCLRHLSLCICFHNIHFDLLYVDGKITVRRGSRGGGRGGSKQSLPHTTDRTTHKEEYQKLYASNSPQRTHSLCFGFNGRSSRDDITTLAGTVTHTHDTHTHTHARIKKHAERHTHTHTNTYTKTQKHKHVYNKHIQIDTHTGYMERLTEFEINRKGDALGDEIYTYIHIM